MITYKYCVYDDDHKIQDSCFDTFEQAFDYAQDGLITHIEEVPVIDGVEQEGEFVWDWDDTWDRDEAIARVAHRHDTVSDDYNISDNTYEGIDEDVEIEIKADRPEELVDLAHCVLGKNCEFFDTDFDELVPEAEVEIVPVAEEPVKLEVEETPETVDPESAFEDNLYPELLKKPEVDVEVTHKDEEPESESEEPESEEKLEDEEVEEESDEDEEVKESLCEEDDGEYVECIWCLDQVKKCNCVHDRDHGYICKDCLPQVEKETNLHLDTQDDDISDEEFVEAFGQAMIDKHNGEELDEASIFSKIGSGLNKFGKAIKRGVEKHVVSSEVLDKYFSEYKVIKYKKAGAGQDDDDSVLVLKEEKVKTYKEAVNIAENYSKISSSGIAVIKATKIKPEMKFLKNEINMSEDGSGYVATIYKDGKEAESHYKELLNDIYAIEDEKNISNKPKEHGNSGAGKSSKEEKPADPKIAAYDQLVVEESLKEASADRKILNSLSDAIKNLGNNWKSNNLDDYCKKYAIKYISKESYDSGDAAKENIKTIEKASLKDAQAAYKDLSKDVKLLYVIGYPRDAFTSDKLDIYKLPAGGLVIEKFVDGKQVKSPNVAEVLDKFDKAYKFASLPDSGFDDVKTKSDDDAEKAKSDKEAEETAANNYNAKLNKLDLSFFGESLTEAGLFNKIFRFGKDKWNELVSGAKAADINDVCASYKVFAVSKESFESGNPKKEEIKIADPTNLEQARSQAKNEFKSGRNVKVVVIGSPHAELQKEEIVGKDKFGSTVLIAEYYYDENGKGKKKESGLEKKIMEQFERCRVYAKNSGGDVTDLTQKHADAKTKEEADAVAKAEKEKSIKAKEDEIKKLEAEIPDLEKQKSDAVAEEDYAKAGELKSAIAEKKQAIEKAKQELVDLQK